MRWCSSIIFRRRQFPLRYRWRWTHISPGGSGTGWSASGDDARGDRRSRYWLSRQGGAHGGINGGVGNHWRSRNPFGRHANNVMRHRLAAAEDMSGHGGSSDSPIFVIHAVDVGDVRDVGNVRHIANVGDVHDAKVVATVVIPGKKWFVGSVWFSCCDVH